MGRENHELYEFLSVFDAALVFNRHYTKHLSANKKINLHKS